MTATAMPDGAIVVEGLTKSYGDHVALRGLDLVVPAGSVFGLLGRNGAGKSTTIRILTTLIGATSGSARIAGHGLDDPAAVRSVIGVALQDVGLDPLLTAREHFMLFGRLRGMSKATCKQRADELLDLFGLTTDADRVVGQFSGGMRRRLDVAMTMIREPKVLFLDEPSAGLDVQSRRQVWAALEELRSRGITVLLTTHDLQEASRFSDRVGILHDGVLLTSGTMAELRARHGRTNANLVFSSVEDAERATTALMERGHRPTPRSREGAATVVDIELATSSEASAVVAAVDAAGIRMVSFEFAPASLEDVFVELTGEGFGVEQVDRSAGNASAANMVGSGR